MTDIDIVDELRGFAEWWRSNPQNSDVIHTLARIDGERSVTAPGLDRAADEIERLRGEQTPWEYQCKIPSSDPAVEHDWTPVEDRTHGMNCSGRMRRRRPAGPWERVPEGENDG